MRLIRFIIAFTILLSQVRSAEEYGYNGVVLGSSGHVRVTVSENEAEVDYVRSVVPGVTKAGLPNATVEHSYTISPRTRQP